MLSLLPLLALMAVPAGDPPAQGNLSDGLRSPDEPTAFSALIAVRDGELREHLPAAAALLTDPRERVRDAASEVVSRLGAGGVEEAVGRVFFELAFSQQAEVVFGLSNTRTPAAVDLLKRIYAWDGMKTVLGIQARRGLKQAAARVREDRRPSHLLVEGFRREPPAVEVALLDPEGVAIVRDVKLRVGCCGRPTRLHRLQASAFQDDGTIWIPLDCAPEPCGKSCVELLYIDDEGVLKVQDHVSKFFSC